MKCLLVCGEVIGGEVKGSWFDVIVLCSVCVWCGLW